MTRRTVLTLTSAAVLFGSLGCGYRVGGKADLVPKAIQTIAIPAFSSTTTDYKLGDMLPNAVAHEFIERTRFQVVKDPSEADAILHGTINRVIRAPSLADPTTGKTTSVQLIIVMSLSLEDRASGKILFTRANLQTREYYELATDPHQLFDESGPAMLRLSQNVARDLVAAVVEGF